MATKPKASDTQLSSDKDKDPDKPIEFDHGEPTELQKNLDEAAKKAAKDPWGTTPTQMRDVHDPAVDPDSDEKAPEKTVADPIDPTASANPPKGGTLPPA